MSVEANWAESLSKETIQNFMAMADGHTLFNPEAFVEAGLPQKIVDQFTRTHRSKRTPDYSVVEKLGEALKSVLDEYISQDGWDPRELLNELRSEDERMAEQVAGELIEKLMAADVETISGYSAKQTMFDDNGNVIESMDAVYGLDLAHGMVSSLGLEYEAKMGRGFQYSAYCKALQGYLDAMDESV